MVKMAQRAHQTFITKFFVPSPQRAKENVSGPANAGCSVSDCSDMTAFSNDAIVAKCKILSAALHPNIGRSWFLSLEDEFDKSYFVQLNVFLENERRAQTVFPPPEEVWTWTHDFDVKDTKVVILGQDPYHGPGQAHGLCFSVPHGISPPPSLINMYKELETDQALSFKRPAHGHLRGWAKQGVLMLNACLTVRARKANSHKNLGWEELTDSVIKLISDECSKGVVFLLWGAYAQKKAAVVDGKKHHLLKTVHPSPLSAHRGFLGCGHFSTCNKLLQQAGRTPINWNDLD